MTSKKSPTLTGKNSIGLMTHIVLGYPSFEENLETVETMAKCGVAFVELQLPFSDPVADGPSMMLANTRSLQHGVTIKACFEQAGKIAKATKISLLFMTYTNIAYQYGIDKFVADASRAGMKGIIIPDLPYEESDQYVKACKKHVIDPIFVVSPNSSDNRLRAISKVASGFIYCTTRTGVTGAQASLPTDVKTYLKRVRQFIVLPLAVGFGISRKEHVDALQGVADYAVIGSAVMDLVHKGKSKGERLQAIADFLQALA